MDVTCESDVFKKMTVIQLKNFLIARGVSVNGYDKISLVKIASAVEKMRIPLLPTVNDHGNGAKNDERLIIHDMEIENPFKITVVNNFIDSPAFGLYDVFNYLICHSTTYDKQGLAAYKSFDDYSLFEDGHVESLMTKTLSNERLHVYVGKVRPAMKVKTDDGKPCYDLWFILEGHGPNRGSVLKAQCMCKGGRDGGCKHIGAAMYSLEDLLNTRGKDSVTSGSCVWVKKANASTKACEVSELVIEKPKLRSYKRRSRDHEYSQNIDVDVRADEDRKPIKKKKLRRLTSLMSLMEQRPAILPLLEKRYSKPKKSPPLLILENVDKNTSGTSSGAGIMKRKVSVCMESNMHATKELVFEKLSFTDKEIDDVNLATVKQCQSKEWYSEKAGFISASKVKQVFTRQATIEKNRPKKTDVSCLVNMITNPKVPPTFVLPQQPHNSLTWGLVNETSARDAYFRVERHKHHNMKLVSKGFLISKKRKFLGASVDNIRTCQCSTKCPYVVVEYKCPWKYKDLHPKQAFLTPEIGGIKKDNTFYLTKNSPYYYQIQTQMFVTGLFGCDFVVWTSQGIFVLPVLYDSTFMDHVCNQLEVFWKAEVLPCMMAESTLNVENKETGYKLVVNNETESRVDTNNTEHSVSPVIAQPCNSPKQIMDCDAHESNSTTTDSVLKYYGVDVYKHDIATLEPGMMLNDTVVTILFEELACPFPFINSLFYSVLCGEQDVRKTTSRFERIQAAQQFFKADVLKNDYIVIPINRRLHWLLAIITPWHILFLDSLSWDISTKRAEIKYLNSYLDHLSKMSGLPDRCRSLECHALKVPKQDLQANNCGIYITMFLSNFEKDIQKYEESPAEYVTLTHCWFTEDEAEANRTRIRNQLTGLSLLARHRKKITAY